MNIQNDGLWKRLAQVYWQDVAKRQEKKNTVCNAAGSQSGQTLTITHTWGYPKCLEVCTETEVISKSAMAASVLRNHLDDQKW